MAQDRPLPTAAMQEAWGHLPYLRYKGGDEWSAACPNCGTAGHNPSSGDPDRFFILPDGTGHSGSARGTCRKCGHVEFAESATNGTPTPEAIEAMQKARQEYEEREREDKRKQQEWLRGADFWRQYHEEMTTEQREIWHSHGIKDWAIEMHKLGYKSGNNGVDGALSIPYFAQYWDNIITLQYRLLCPETPNDKYRFLKGSTQELFRPWPEDELSGVVLVLEGAKKALITYEVAHDIRYRGKPVTMVASPSKNVPERLIEQLHEAELLIWMLDPDAYIPTRADGRVLPPSMDRNVKLAGKERSLIVRPAEKIDDMIMKYSLGRNTIEAMVNQAGPWFGYRH